MSWHGASWPWHKSQWNARLIILAGTRVIATGVSTRIYSPDPTFRRSPTRATDLSASSVFFSSDNDVVSNSVLFVERKYPAGYRRDAYPVLKYSPELHLFICNNCTHHDDHVVLKYLLRLSTIVEQSLKYSILKLFNIRRVRMFAYGIVSAS